MAASTNTSESLFTKYPRCPIYTAAFGSKTRYVSDLDELKEEQRAVQFDFIISELDLAITFCETALAADTTIRAVRNICHANEAYAAATHFTKRIRLTPKMVSEIDDRVLRLKDLFRKLDSDANVKTV